MSKVLLRWCADGELAGVALDGTYHLMEVAKNKMERTQFARRGVPSCVVALSPDGRIVEVVSEADSQRITLLDGGVARSF